MAKYLIDYENTYIEGLDGLENLTSEDEVCVFYTQNRCGMTFDLHKRFLVSKAAIKLLEVSSAPPKNPYSKASISNSIKNALDLQLTLYLGYLLASDNGDEDIYIISKDNDFGLDVEFFHTYLEGCSKEVYLFETIQKALDKDLVPLEEIQISEENTTENQIEVSSENNEMEKESESELNQEKTPESTENKSLGNNEETAQKEETNTEPCNKEKMILVNKPNTSLVVENNISSALTMTVQALLESGSVSVPDKDYVNRICKQIKKSEDFLTLNNNLANLLRDGEKVKEIYHVIKPQFELLKKL